LLRRFLFALSLVLRVCLKVGLLRDQSIAGSLASPTFRPPARLLVCSLLNLSMLLPLLSPFRCETHCLFPGRSCTNSFFSAWFLALDIPVALWKNNRPLVRRLITFYGALPPPFCLWVCLEPGGFVYFVPLPSFFSLSHWPPIDLLTIQYCSSARDRTPVVYSCGESFLPLPSPLRIHLFSPILVFTLCAPCYQLWKRICTF